MFCATSSRRLVCVWFRGTALNEGSRVCITQAATPLWFVALTDPQPRSGTPLPTRQPIACSAALAALSQIGSTIAPCTQPLRGVIRRRCVRFVCIPVSSNWLNWKPDTPPSSLHAMFCSCSIAIAELRFASECRQNVVSPRSIGINHEFITDATSAGCPRSVRWQWPHADGGCSHGRCSDGGASHRSFSCGKETSRHARVQADAPLPHGNSARSHLISPARITGHSHMLDARTTAKPRAGC